MTAIRQMNASMNTIRNPPGNLAELPIWLMWRFEENPVNGKQLKVPYYINGNKRRTNGGDYDINNLANFAAAKSAAARRNFDGVGIATLPHANITIIDFDHCTQNGVLHPKVLEIASRTYSEYSPSGEGVHAIFQGHLPDGKHNDTAEGEPFEVEFFSWTSWVTYTGNILESSELMTGGDDVEPLNADCREIHTRRIGTRDHDPNRDAFDDLCDNQRHNSSTDDARGMLAKLDPNMPRLPWRNVGMALKHQFGDEGFNLWDEWSARAKPDDEGQPVYPGRGALIGQWQSFKRTKGNLITMAFIKGLVRDLREKNVEAEMARVAEAAEDVSDDDEMFSPVDEGGGSASSTGSGEADEPKLKFPLINVGEFVQRPTPNWLIKGILPQQDLTLTIGESQAGKTFVALDQAVHLAMGWDWMGHRVPKPVRVGYVAAESASGVVTRLRAIQNHYDVDLSDAPIGIIDHAPNFLEPDDPVEVLKAIYAFGGVDVLFIDTLAQCAPGGNENSGEDIGTVLRYCKRIHETCGATINLVHHLGKDVTKGARGWSGLKAAAASELTVSRTEEQRQIRVSKLKDGEDGEVLGFGLKSVMVGIDEDGDDITSCVIEREDVQLPEKAVRLGAVEKMVDAAISEQMRGGMCEVDDVVSLVVERKPGAKAKNIRRSVEGLIGKKMHVYRLEGEFIRLIEGEEA